MPAYPYIVSNDGVVYVTTGLDLEFRPVYVTADEVTDDGDIPGQFAQRFRAEEIASGIRDHGPEILFANTPELERDSEYERTHTFVNVP